MKAKPKAKDNFREAILTQPVDVEELGKQGRRKGVCPYYTARSAVPDAQLVLLPYSALLAEVSPITSHKAYFAPLLPMSWGRPHSGAVLCNCLTAGALNSEHPRAGELPKISVPGVEVVVLLGMLGVLMPVS